MRTLAALKSVNFPPGSGWNYNNGAYALLAQIVARLSQRTFADFLAERIFKPIGMNDTLLRSVDTDLVPNSATLHVPSPAGGYVRGVFGPPISGEGGIVSTVDDMLSWMKHMNAPVVRSHETWRVMRTPMTSHGYALGLIAGQHRGLDVLHHGGAVFGGACQMLKVLEPDLDVIVITNGLGGLDLFKLVDRIIESCIPGLPPDADEIQAEPTFVSGWGGRIRTSEWRDPFHQILLNDRACNPRLSDASPVALLGEPLKIDATACENEQWM